MARVARGPLLQGSSLLFCGFTGVFADCVSCYVSLEYVFSSTIQLGIAFGSGLVWSGQVRSGQVRSGQSSSAQLISTLVMRSA